MVFGKFTGTLRDSLAGFWTVQRVPQMLPNEPECRKTIPQGRSRDSCFSGAFERKPSDRTGLALKLLLRAGGSTIWTVFDISTFSAT